MNAPALGALRDCVAALVTEVQLLDPGWAPPHVPDLPDDERPCALNCGELGSHRQCPIHGDVAWNGKRSSLAPSPDYSTMETLPPPAAAHDLCGCEEAVALRLRLVQAERRADLWHKLARMKHRLLHMAEPRRFDSQLVRPVQGG